MANRALARPVNIVARTRRGLLAKMLADVAEDDIGIVTAASRASDLDSPEAGEAMLRQGKYFIAQLGWTSEAELRIAIDAKRNSKMVPFYLRMAHERTLMRYRGQDGERPGAASVIVMPSDPAPDEKVDEGHALPAMPPPGDDETNS